MIKIKDVLKRALTITLTACIASTVTISAFADEPYNTYNYDEYGEDYVAAVPAQSAYMVKEVFSGDEMDLGRLTDENDPLYVSKNAKTVLNAASDLFLDEENQEFWVADTGNNRILRLDKNLKIIGRYYGVTGSKKKLDKKTGLSKFNTPTGIYVRKSMLDGNLYLYVADTENDRVVKAKVNSPTECVCVQEYVKPDSALYDAETFKPSKVVVDNAENVYAVASSVNTGAVQYKKSGEFTGFYGANHVEVTAAVMAQKLWRKIASNDQIKGMTRSVPTEYANFDMDDEGFIYTVTEISNESNKDVVKKLNPAGYNIWDNEAGDEYEFGDLSKAKQDLANDITFKPKLTDIVVSNNGMINILDYETGRIFQYDELCNLVCIFGGKNNAYQKGSFLAPNAIESYNNDIYVLDGTKNDITVFAETTFGSKLHEAYLLYDQGKYVEAEPYWNEVIQRDGGYSGAYVGLGKAVLNSDDYDTALKYFKVAYDQDDYDKSFKYARSDFLNKYFTIIIIVLAVVVVLLLVRGHIRKKRRKAKERGEK
ncbi:MAG: hypothetical protein ACI4RC_00325 [Oscillospiraceae bacterium]